MRPVTLRDLVALAVGQALAIIICLRVDLQRLALARGGASVHVIFVTRLQWRTADRCSRHRPARAPASEASPRERRNFAHSGSRPVSHFRRIDPRQAPWRDALRQCLHSNWMETTA